MLLLFCCLKCLQFLSLAVLKLGVLGGDVISFAGIFSSYIYGIYRTSDNGIR